MLDPQPDKISSVGQAFKLWKRFGFTAPKDLVLEDLAWTMGVLVLEGDLDSADARLIRKGSKGLIRLSSAIPEPGRKRFAVAHEIGHWLLHGSISQIVSCTNEDMVANYKCGIAELEANIFAAELLMPQALFLKRLQGTDPSVPLLKDLASYFLTTLTASIFRFVEVTDGQYAMIVSERGRIRWWRASEAYAGSIWLQAGEDLSQETGAGEYFASGEGLGDDSERVSASAWLGDRAQEDESLNELSIAIPRYHQVISLIWPS